MKKHEDIPNLGETIISISGRDTGVRVMLIGEKDQIIRILKQAMRSSSALRELIQDLINEKGPES
jgi:hypothetical protein